jgi:hypothetical protein
MRQRETRAFLHWLTKGNKEFASKLLDAYNSADIGPDGKISLEHSYEVHEVVTLDELTGDFDELMGEADKLFDKTGVFFEKASKALDRAGETMKRACKRIRSPSSIGYSTTITTVTTTKRSKDET